MSLILGREQFDVVWPELKMLTEEHYKEVSLLSSKIELDIDQEYYRQLEEMGMLSIFTLREMGRLVGYASFYLVGSPRYKGKRLAQNDAVFMQDSVRKGFAGIRFIKDVTGILSQEADMIAWHVKDKYDFSPILIRMGFIKQDTVYSLLVEK